MIINIPNNSDFSINNIPFGIFSTAERSKRVGVAIGDQILDLLEWSKAGFGEVESSYFDQVVLNPFIKLRKEITNQLRIDVQDWLKQDADKYNEYRSLFVSQMDATMHLPIHIGDYTDFYSSIEHATNVGKMFRDPENALLPNWRHLPVGYHGRASSIVVSGTPITRPSGQVLNSETKAPEYKATQKLDFELEMGFIVGKENTLGHPISVDEAEDYIFGMVLFNDWSARDIQKWEYVPLGPFLGKNFTSSMSPWVVTMEALEPFRIDAPKQEPQVLPYLDSDRSRNIDIKLKVELETPSGTNTTLSNSNFKYMYWDQAQQLAHHTVNGCNVRVGDLMASGTISGTTPESYGCMLEISWGGKKPIIISDGTTRSFIEDGDTVVMKGYCQKDGIRVGFGELSTLVRRSMD